MAGKLQDSIAYPPRVMRADRAAAYLSMSERTFAQLVKDGLLPPGIRLRGLVVWDRLELDQAVENWKDDGTASQSSWAKIRDAEKRGER